MPSMIRRQPTVLRRQRPAVLAQPGRTGRHAALPRTPGTPVPWRDDGWFAGFAARVPEADGGVAGPGRPGRLHALAGGEAGPLRPSAGQPHARASRSATRRPWNSAAIAQGLLVTSYDGRPIKIEGNPTHPLNRGAADAIAQASVLEVYDPDRSRGVIRRKDGDARTASSWEEFAAGRRRTFTGRRRRDSACSARRRVRRAWPTCGRGCRRPCPRLSGSSTSRFRTTTSARGPGWHSASRCRPCLELAPSEDHRGPGRRPVRRRTARWRSSTPGISPPARRLDD